MGEKSTQPLHTSAIVVHSSSESPNHFCFCRMLDWQIWLFTLQLHLRPTRLAGSIFCWYNLLWTIITTNALTTGFRYLSNHRIYKSFWNKIHTPQHAIVCLASLCSYAGSLDGEFVFDDTVAIVQNPDVTMANRSVDQIFRHDFWGFNLTDPDSHKSYRPLTIYSFRLQMQSNTNEAIDLIDTAYQMKIINLCLHCFVSGLFLEMLSSSTLLVTSSIVPIAASLLFAVHPAHVEAVAGIVGRAELLCAICFVLAIQISYWTWQRTGKVASFIFGYVTLFALAMVALMCKETGITILVNSRDQKNLTIYYLYLFVSPCVWLWILFETIGGIIGCPPIGPGGRNGRFAWRRPLFCWFSGDCGWWTLNRPNLKSWTIRWRLPLPLGHGSVQCWLGMKKLFIYFS